MASVEIDNRLTDLFHKRTSAPESDEDMNEESFSSNVHVNQAVADMSWFSQFQVVAGTNTTVAAPEPEYDDAASIATSFTIDRSAVKPFWATEDTKKTISIWMGAKSALAKDCQKQRKAAIRKTARH